MLSRATARHCSRRLCISAKRYTSSVPAERDVVIVGGGPAGLTLASALGETSLNDLIYLVELPQPPLGLCENH